MIENVKMFRKACKNVRNYLSEIKKLQIMMLNIKDIEIQNNNKTNQYNNCNELMQLYYQYVFWVYKIINKVPTPYYQPIIHELFILKSLKGHTGKMIDCTDQSIYNECKLQLEKAISNEDVELLQKITQEIKNREKLIGKET